MPPQDNFGIHSRCSIQNGPLFYKDVLATFAPGTERKSLLGSRSAVSEERTQQSIIDG